MMLRQMHALDLTVDDALVDQYINDLGYRLVASSDRPKDHFSFFIVKDTQINAFAAPGGYIGVNAGLINITSSESELAGVIAHEIGHITQNHLYRAFEDSKKNAPLMALVLLGAIAAGAGGGAGDAAPAVLMGGQGCSCSDRSTSLARTRSKRIGSASRPSPTRATTPRPWPSSSAACRTPCAWAKARKPSPPCSRPTR